MAADGSIIIDTRINSKSAKADLQAIKAAAQATTRQITGLDKQLASATSKRSKLADDLKQARAAADSTARALDDVNARLDAARGKIVADLQAEYPHLNAGEISRAAEGMLGKSSAADIKPADKLAAEYNKQAAAVERLTQEYQQQTAAAERLEQQKQGLVSQLGREQQAVEQATRAYDRRKQSMAAASPPQKVPIWPRVPTRPAKPCAGLAAGCGRSCPVRCSLTSFRPGFPASCGGRVMPSCPPMRSALPCVTCRGAASVAAAPLIEALGSALAYVINILARGISYLAQFVSLLTGKSLSAMKNSAKAMNC